MAILKKGGRPATRRSMLIPVVATALLTLGVAALRPAAPVAARNSDAATPTVPAAITPAAAEPWVARLPIVGPIAATQAAVQAAGGDSACWADRQDGMSFSGSSSMTEVAGQTIIHERVGTLGGTTRIIQKSFGDLRLCMVADAAGEPQTGDRPSQWLGRAPRVILEARRGGMLQRLEVSRDSGGSQRTSWRVGSAERPFDAAAREWRDRMLAVLDTTWDLSMLRGQVSTLRGEISTIRGQESTLRGEISTLRGEVSTMRGRASTVRGEASTLQGQISSIRGHLSSLRGAISSEQGAISSLRATYNPSQSERTRIDAAVAQHEAQIARLNKEIADYDEAGKIADVERQMKALDEDGKVAAIEAEIRAFDLEGKVAAVERRIAELDVQGKVAGIERQIAGLDAERRGREMEMRRESQLKALETAIAAIK